MTSLELSDLVSATSGTLAVRGERAITSGVVTDSRRVVPGCVFVALRGGRVDGHAFAAAATEQGAAAVLVSRLEGTYAAGASVVVVEDTLAALQRLASWWRGQLKPLHVIGLTGSSGKTSTKDMVRAVLAQRYRTVATRGNFNNHLGVPLSILEAEQGAEAAVWEMGMNHAGELAPLCAMTRPQLGIITTIGSSHMEFLGSREKIAEEKCAVARCLPEEGVMIYPARDDFAAYIASQTRAERVPVGGYQSPVQALNAKPTPQGTCYDLQIEGLGVIPVTLPVPGVHMVANSLLAAAAGWKLGCSPEEIAAGLASVSLTPGRLSCRQVEGYTVVDDTYNANPESMRAALETVASLRGQGRCIAVLGKMGELGPQGVAAHADIGWLAASLGFAALIVMGPECQETLALCQAASETIPALLVSTPEEAATALRSLAAPGDVLLFKGSRAAGMERAMCAFFPTLQS